MTTFDEERLLSRSRSTTSIGSTSSSSPTSLRSSGYSRAGDCQDEPSNPMAQMEGLRFLGRFERGLSGMQRLLRWPFLIVVFVIIVVELFVYLVLRLGISLYEVLHKLMCRQLAHTDHRDRTRRAARGSVVSESMLDKATCYSDWLRIATVLDTNMSHDFYRTIDRSPFYDYRRVKRLTSQLEECMAALRRGSNEAQYPAYVVDALRSTLQRIFNQNAAGLGLDNERLYAETFAGTKLLLQRFIDMAVESTTLLHDDPTTNPDALRAHLSFFVTCRAAFGRTALCLSSGGSMAYYHFGVVQALLETHLLPTVICGSSGGAFAAALVCTRTDAELDTFISDQIYKVLTPCNESWGTWIRRFLSSGRVFDEANLTKLLRPLLFQDMTFQEAFDKTGRILNITCTNDNKWGAPILLNYQSAPRVVIWSAVIASSAIPPLIRSVTLVSKSLFGKIEPFLDFGQCWSDGAIKNDIPHKQLAEQFNVNFLVVSQVNPHIIPFVFEPRGSGGRPSVRGGSSLRGGFVSSALETLLKLEMRKWLRLTSELDLMPMLFKQDWSVLFLQKYYGNVTLYPCRGWSSLRDIALALSDPDEERMRRYLRQGRAVTYPKCAMIRNHLIFEQTLQQAEKCMRTKLNEARRKSWST